MPSHALPPRLRSFRRPGVMAGLGAAAGAWTGLQLPGEPWWWLAAAGAAAAFALRRRPGVLRPYVALVAIFFLGVTAGTSTARPAPGAAIDALVDADQPVHFVGRVLEPVERKLAPPRWRSAEPQPRVRLLVRIDRVEVDGEWLDTPGSRALLGGADVPFEAGVGDAVEGRARLMRPRAPKNPGEEDSRPRLARAGIAYVGGLERGALAVLEPSDGLARGAERFRARYAAFAHATLGDPDRAALVAALAVGERGGVSPDLEQAFNASGLAHVLSISGLHLAVAVAALAWVLWRLLALSEPLSRRVAPRRLAAALSIPLTAGYVVLIGAPPPAVRAAIGMGLAMGAIAAGRRVEGYATLGWCLALVSLLDPASLGLVSTQLSFLGVLGLIHLMPRLRELVPLPPPDAKSGRLRRFGEAALQLALGSVAATLATAPLTAAYFERTSLVAALANLAAWPASTLIVPAGAVAAGAFSVWPPLAWPFVQIAGLCAWCLVAFARWFGSLPMAAVTVAPPSPLAVVAFYVLVLALLQVRRGPGKPMLVLAATSAAVLLVVTLGARGVRADGKLEVTFLAVGQGDGAFIRFPGGSTMVVDSGGEVSGRFDPGARIMAPFLRHQGVTRIDRLVASHPHPDHIGGFAALFERFEVRELWHNGDGLQDGRALTDLVALARRYGTDVIAFTTPMPEHCPQLEPLTEVDALVASLAVGDPRCSGRPPVVDIDGVKVEILHPLGGPYGGSFPELHENDNSLVLRLVHGDVRILLPGDVEHEGEALLLARGWDVSADLLKAPHHGSRTSSTQPFVDAVQPTDVVLCLGEKNQFNFPAPEVVERYEQAGVRIHRTDLHSVTFVSDGRQLTALPHDR